MARWAIWFASAIHATLTAGGAGDDTLVDGLTIDREAIGQGSMPDSALFGVLYEATLAATKTLSIAYDIQTSPDGTNWTDYQSGAAAILATGPTGGATIKGSFNIQVNLRSAQRYVRLNYTPDLSNTATDTAYCDGVGFFAGFDRLPASN